MYVLCFVNQIFEQSENMSLAYFVSQIFEVFFWFIFFKKHQKNTCGSCFCVFFFFKYYREKEDKTLCIVVLFWKTKQITWNKNKIMHCALSFSDPLLETNLIFFGGVAFIVKTMHTVFLLCVCVCVGFFLFLFLWTLYQILSVCMCCRSTLVEKVNWSKCHDQFNTTETVPLFLGTLYLLMVFRKGCSTV